MKSETFEIMEELTALGQHYMRVVRTPEQEERFLRDYLETLKDYPISAIKLGCKAWRTSEATKFPTVGQLVAKVRSHLPREERGTKAEPWRPISNEEYERLPLLEKIRHRLILASELRKKAGPMWAGGRPLTREEMPERWHELIRKAEGHVEAARELRSKLREIEERA